MSVLKSRVVRTELSKPGRVPRAWHAGMRAAAGTALATAAWMILVPGTQQISVGSSLANAADGTRPRTPTLWPSDTPCRSEHMLCYT